MFLSVGTVAPKDEMRNAYKILVGRPEGKRTLEKPRPRLEDSIKMCLQEMGWEFMDWILLVQSRDQLQFLWRR
jgi:hypothetical protein